MKSKLKFNAYKFSWDVAAYRTDANQSLRQAAAEIGISFAALNRIENGKVPDVVSFATVCKWMGGKQMDEYFFEPLTFHSAPASPGR